LDADNIAKSQEKQPVMDGKSISVPANPPASHINAGRYAPREPAPIVDGDQPLISARVGATMPMKLRKD